MLGIQSLPPARVALPTPEITRTAEPRLDALTALRFFAAVSIVLLHFSELLCTEIRPFTQPMALHQGVSFFYVLSGFILTYVYPNLVDKQAVVKFLRARVARVYPMHIFSLALLMLFACPNYSSHEIPKLIAANLLLVQDWLPFKDFYWSCNAPAWSISCEFFFYLCFPFVIQNFASSWAKKLGLCLLATTAMLVVCTIFKAPVTEAGVLVISQDWFTSLSPLVRLSEFALGMCVALFFSRERSKSAGARGETLQPSAAGTVAEVALCVATIAYLFIGQLMPFLATAHLLPPQSIQNWILTSAGAPVYGLLIYAFASQRGLLSTLLCRRPFVLLGEISFALYLIHFPILSIFARYQDEFSQTPQILTGISFWICVLSASYICFELIEKPFRGLVLGQGIKGFPKRISFALAANLLMVGGVWLFEFKQVESCRARTRAEDAVIAKQIMAVTPATLRGTAFGDSFALDAYGFDTLDGQTRVRLVWRSLKNEKLKYHVGFHLIDRRGENLRQKDYEQSRAKWQVKPGRIWVDTVRLTPAEMNQVARIGICVFEEGESERDDVHLLAVAKGERDYGGKRLLIDVPGGQ